MYKIDVGSAAASLPAPAAPGAPGFFTDGDPIAGTPGTIVTADFMNMTMMELLNLITAAGLTPSKTTYTQVRDAVSALALAQAGNFPGFTQYTTTSTMSAADAGKVIILGGGGSYTVTLPSGAAMPANGAFHFFGQGATVTILRAGTDVISIGSATGGSSVTSFAMSGSDFCTIVWRAGGWTVISGTPLFAQGGGSFSASTGVSGYQKLPSGVILQWGIWTASATPGVASAVTFPIAFPNAARIIIPAAGNPSTTNSATWYDGLTANGVNLHAAVASAPGYYFALGI